MREPNIARRMDRKAMRFAVGAKVGIHLINLPRTLRISPRKSESIRSKKFSFFFTQFWKLASGTPHSRVSGKAVNSLVKYITRIDDLLDQPGGWVRSMSWIKHRKDVPARGHISALVRTVRTSKQLTPLQKQTVLRSIAQSRRTMMRSIEEYSRKESPDLKDIIRMHRGTTGEMGRIIARVFNLTYGVDSKTAALLERTLMNVALVAQLTDDVKDCNEDRQNQTPNILNVVAQKNPSELMRIRAAPEVDFRWLRLHAPASYRHILQIGSNYLGNMPEQSHDQGVAVAAARLFWGSKVRG